MKKIIYLESKNKKTNVQYVMNIQVVFMIN